jgi:hypothetical protein
MDCTVKNSLWEDQDTESLMFGDDSKLLMDQCSPGKTLKHVPSKILRDLQNMLSQVDGEHDDY